MPVQNRPYAELMNKLKQATSRNQVLIVTTSSGQNLTVDSNFGRHNQRQFKTDQGFFDYSMIHGYSFENDPTRQDAIGSDQYSDLTSLGGFVNQPHYRTDASSSDNHRELLRQYNDGTIDHQTYKQRKDSLGATAAKRFDNSSNGLKIPTVDLSEDQKQQIRGMIQNGSDCDAIRSQFGNVSSTDLSSLANEAGIDTLSKIMQRLT